MTIEEVKGTEILRAFVHQVLIPNLKPGDLVILDNLSPRKIPKRSS